MIPDRLRDLDTPALLIELDIMDRNLKTMADFFKDRPSTTRPHFKTHKTPAIAHKQIQSGAIGITCAKLGEAEVLGQAGIQGLLIANQVVGEIKTRRLANLARHTDVMVAVDDPRNVREIGAAAATRRAEVGIVIEFEVGMDRCGVLADSSCVELAKVIHRTKGVRFRGIMGYEGHCVNEPDPVRRRKETTKANNLVAKGKRLIEAAGIPVEIVSGAGTGTYDVTGTHPDFTEVQVGSYVAMDVCYHRIRPEFDIALSVLCSVVSRPSSSRGVIDAGLKTFSRGFDMPAAKNRPGVKFTSLSEEHGSLALSGKGRSLKVGDKVEFYTAHCCEAFNLHNKIYGIRKGRVETEWDIAARGRLA